MSWDEDTEDLGFDTIIFDIDGTLTNPEHRRTYLAGSRPDWGKFFDEMVNDPPLRDVCLLAELLGDHPLVKQGAVRLFLFSGRPETHRKETETQLLKYARSYFQAAEGLLMRAAGDNRQDTIVKYEMLEKIKSEGYNPRLVIDDRPSVCDMWVEEGITCLQHVNHLDEWEEPKTWEPGKLVMMVGPSGAGKSTYVKERWQEHEVVSSDITREQVTGDFKDQSKNDQVFHYIKQLVTARNNSGLLTVVDATHLRARDRRAMRDAVHKDTKIWYHVVDRKLSEKITTGGWRNSVQIGDMTLVEKHNQSFKSGIKHIMAGDNDPRVTVIDERKY